MTKKRLTVIALTLVMVLVLVPTAFAENGAEDTEAINWTELFKEYNLDLSDKEAAAVEFAIKEAYENYEINEDVIRDVLNDLEIKDTEEAEDPEDEDGIGQELSTAIMTYKSTARWEEERGKGLSNMIQGFLIDKGIKEKEDEEDETEEETEEEEKEREEETENEEEKEREEVQAQAKNEENNQEMQKEEKGMPEDVEEKVEEKKEEAKENSNKGKGQSKGKGKGNN